MDNGSENGGRRTNVLIVDDEEDILTYLIAVLRDNGMNAVGVTQADEALREIERRVPDLLLLDIMMPKQSGLSLYRDIRSRETTSAIPVIFISAYSRAEEVGKLGFRPLEGSSVRERYLEKPVTVEALLSGIRELLGRPERGA
jgi:two-component system, OmpR family, phosphate regulon response regulator PhoB